MLAGSQQGEVGLAIVEPVQQHLWHLTLLVQHKPEAGKRKYFSAAQLKRSTCPVSPSPRRPSWNRSGHAAWRGGSLHHKFHPEAPWTHHPAALWQTCDAGIFYQIWANVGNYLLPFHLLSPPLCRLIHLLIRSHLETRQELCQTLGEENLCKEKQFWSSALLANPN